MRHQTQVVYGNSQGKTVGMQPVLRPWLEERTLPLPRRNRIPCLAGMNRPACKEDAWELTASGVTSTLQRQEFGDLAALANVLIFEMSDTRCHHVPAPKIADDVLPVVAADHRQPADVILQHLCDGVV